jgi:KDO2-lipid IV(A) lauroyltransferase
MGRARMRPRRLTTNIKALIARIPKRYLMSLGTLLGDIALLVDAPHRRTVIRNIEFTHPHMTRLEIQQLCRRVFRHLAVTFLEICQMTCFSREDIVSRFRVVGAEHCRGLLRGNKGALLISAHLGNYEMALLYAACYFQAPVLTVAKKFNLPFYDRFLADLRTRSGARVIFKEGALPEMVKAVRGGGILVLLIDQSRSKDIVDVTFFGRKATAAPGPALVALRCDIPVIPVVCFRDADGTLTGQFYPPLSMQRTGDLRTDILVNTQLMTDAVERAIREHIDQWFWYHLKWKKYYPELYPGSSHRKRARQRRGNRRSSSEAS